MAYTGTYRNKSATIIEGKALGYKIESILKPRKDSEFQRIVVQTVARSRIDESETVKGLKIKSTWLVPTEDGGSIGTMYNQVPEHWHPNCNYKIGAQKKAEDGKLLVRVTPAVARMNLLRHIKISESELATHVKKGFVPAEIVAKHAVRK